MHFQNLSLYVKQRGKTDENFFIEHLNLHTDV